MSGKEVKIHFAGLGGANPEFKRLELELLDQHPTGQLNQGRIYHHTLSDHVIVVNQSGQAKQLAYLSDIPVAINGIDGSVIYTGTGVPAAGLGVNKDHYLDKVTGDYYSKATGSWVFQVNIKGPTGTGIAGTNGNTILFGTIDPISTQGVNGDGYINTVSLDLFKKASGAWTKQGNLKGTPGTTGIDGFSLLSGSADPVAGSGKDGDSYINYTSWDYFKRLTGTWSKLGNMKGASGTNGASFLSGVIDPAAGTGSNGDTYLNVTSGDVFAKSAGSWSKTGNLRGLTGAAGASVLSGIVDPVVGQGNNNDSFINLVSGDTFQKNSGVWGKTGNLKGPKGDSLGVVLKSFYGQTGSLSGTSVITSKDSVPLITEGTEVWRFTFAASEINSLLEVEFIGLTDSSRRAAKIFFVLFRDGVCMDWGAVTTGNSTLGNPTSFVFKHLYRNTDLNNHTYVLRMGVSDATTTWYLGRGADKNMGNVNEAYYTFKETRTS